VFPAKNVEVLAEKLTRAFADGERLEQQKVKALAHIKTWSPERNIEALIQAIGKGIQRVRGS
jgi:hypothetical protein